MKRNKQLVTGFFAIALGIVGILSTMVTNATAITEQKVFYETGDMKIYWEQGTAPVKEGYVFGGWFSSEDEKIMWL